MNLEINGESLKKRFGKNKKKEGNLFCLLQVLEFDLKGSSLDASSFITVVVKDYETIGKDK